MARNTIILICLFIFHFTNIHSQSSEVSGLIKQDDLDPSIKLELQKIGRDVINFLRWKRLPQAEKKLQEYEAIHQNTDEYFYLRSAIYFTKKQFNLAEADLKTSLSINDKHEAAYYLIGMIYGIRADWNRSNQAFKVAVDLSPYNPHYYNNLAISNYMLGEYEQSRIALGKAIEQKANYSEAKILLIKTDRKLNKSESAFKLAEKLYKENPKLTMVKYLYSELLFETKQDFQKVIQLLDKDRNMPISTMRILARSYDSLLQESQSESLWKEIVESGLANDEDRKNYINCLIKQNKLTLANRFAQEFIQQDTNRVNEIRVLFESGMLYNFAIENFYYFFPLSK